MSKIKDLEDEIWRDIKDFEGLYQISNLGRIKSLGRTINLVVNLKNQIRHTKDKIIKPSNKFKNSISLRKNDTNFTLYIPSLLKESFGFDFGIENLEGEIWKDVDGYVGLYQISNKGRLKSFHKGEKIIKSHINYEGYALTKLNKDKNKKTISIHRLVALAFIPNPNNFATVHHRDNIKTNNCVENLEWMTDENNRDIAVKDKRCDYSHIKKSTFDKVKTKKNHRKVPNYYNDPNFNPSDEIWVKVNDFAYKVSSYGRVKRIYKNHERFLKPVIHVQDCAKFPLSVSLYKNWQGKGFLLHRLVGLHFLENPNNLPEVNHKDGDRFNNHISNLEWSTHQDNMEHAAKTGLLVRGENCGLSKLTNEKVIQIRKLHEIDKTPINELSRMFDMSRKSIVNVVKRKTWKHI